MPATNEYIRHAMIIPSRRPSPCSKCLAVPLCESRCEEIPQHERECAFLMENRKESSNEVTTADADLITLTRAALLRTRDPGAYEKVMALESNKGSKVQYSFVKGPSDPVDRLSRVSISDEAARLVGCGEESATAEKNLPSW